VTVAAFFISPNYTGYAMASTTKDLHVDGAPPLALTREVVIAIMAFLTVVDLFATQAILPALVGRYGVSPAAMGTAVNLSTFGMAVSGIIVALVSHCIDRRRGVAVALALLSVPTALLAIAPNLLAFALLRIAQGVLMAAAFTLTLAHLAEETSGRATSAAFAAYITGNVASNLFGRLISASVVDMLGVSANFIVFAAMNLAGAALAYRALTAMRMKSPTQPMGGRTVFWQHLRNPALCSAFAIGFCILFAFVGTFTYVSFVLVQPPFSLGMMSIGFVYLVFLPSLLTTPLAGLLAARFGTSSSIMAGLSIAGAGLPFVLSSRLSLMLVGLALIAIGTFLAQAVATGFVGRTAIADKAAASGLYLGCYFTGGLIGSAVLGRLFELYGWTGCVGGIAVTLMLAIIICRCSALRSG
jgi:MFS transporter, YNFM family, putative membrane transport protein